MSSRLALFGSFPGARMLDAKEEVSVVKTLRTRSLSRFGGFSEKRNTILLEHALGSYTKRMHTLVVSSGTAALHTALVMAEIKPGDEVIIPSYCWISIVMAIIAVGATPVIAPIDASLNLDTSALESAFSTKTRAIVAVHMRGFPCDIIKIQRVARGTGIRIIEDGSQCLGGTIDNNPVGFFGDISTFSFQLNKLITAGEGGAILCNSEKMATRARQFHDCGMTRDTTYTDPVGDNAIQHFGLNYRLSEVSAAIALTQFSKLKDTLRRLGQVRLDALESLQSEILQFDLQERASVPGTSPNNAFLCLSAPDSTSCQHAYNALTHTGVPAQLPGRIDPHHYLTWINFLERDNLAFRCVTNTQSSTTLNKHLFIELNPAPL